MTLTLKFRPVRMAGIINLGGYTDYFALFGAAIASYWGVKAACSLLNTFKVFVLGKVGLCTNLKSQGAWAVVTGATDGIGKAYAQELARQGINIVLISRSPEKLNDVALEIESKQKVKTRAIPIDFSGGPEIYTKIKQELVALDIGVLVNNVGMSYDHPEYFCDMQNGEEAIQKMISVNIMSATMMTYLVLPSMVEKKTGVIINIASGAALRPVPYLSVYSATKAYLDTFSRSIDLEYRPKGIYIQSVLPYFVATKMSKIRRANIFAPDPNAYARSALSTVGLTNRTTGYWPHGLQKTVTHAFPSFLLDKFMIMVMSGARKMALKKKQQKKE